MHCLQHVEFEDAAQIGRWARDRGHSLSSTLVSESNSLPAPDAFDWLVVMGGPMSTYEEDRYPWLAGEKRLIAQAIAQDKRVLGVCLGAQMIADALGGAVAPNRFREIGWHEAWLTGPIRGSLFEGFPDIFVPFHWHGDMLSLPPGACHLVASEACPNQAFQFGPRVLGLQFHLEYTEQNIRTMIEQCAEDLAAGPYIQTPSAMVGHEPRILQAHALLHRLLEAMENAT